MYLISDKESHSNENDYSVKIKPVSGSCHIWDLIYMKVLLRKGIGILVEDSEGEKYNEELQGYIKNETKQNKSPK